MKKTPAAYFFECIKSQRREFFFLVFFSATYSLGQSILPYFIKHIINQLYVFPSSVHHALVLNGIFLVSFWLISSVAIVIQGKLLENSLPVLRKNICLSAIEQIQQLHHSTVTKLSPGVLSRRVTDLAASAEKIVHFFFTNVINIVVVMILSMALFFSVSYVFALLTLLWIVLHAFNAVSYLYSGTAFAAHSVESSANFSGKLVDFFSNIRAVHLFSTQEHERNYLASYLVKEENAHRAALKHLEGMKIRQSLLSAVFILSAVIILIVKQLEHQISLGDFSMVLLLVFNISNIVWSITFQLINIVKELGTFSSSVETIFSCAVSTLPVDVYDKGAASGLLGVSFNNISFRYPGSDYLFNKFTLSIKAGEKVAISASSGRGKTTLVNLLLGLYEPSEGDILINDRSIKSFSTAALQKMISYVPQENLFFNRSVLDNVRYGNVQASDEDVFEACRLAQCHEFIEQLELGYGTCIGEKGCYLSGGQLQRLALARALLKKSPILVLDEPTSSLDDENSQLIENIILTISRNATLILITHRLSTLRCAERIIELNNS